MKKVKSNLLKSLIKKLNHALYSENNPEYGFNKIQELSDEYKKSRRDFIFQTSRAGIFLGVGSMISFEGCFNHDSNKNDKGNNDSTQTKQQPSIAIVGGGIAGLHCAHILQKAGYIAQIYEADKRVGGRIFTQENILGQGITTELGGEFIDSNHQDMINLCSEFNLTLLNRDLDANEVIKETYFFNDKHYTEQEVFNEFKKVAKKIEKDKTSCGKDYDTPEAEKLDNTSLEKYINQLQCAKWLREILDTAFKSEYGLDTSEQSSLNFIAMISTDTTSEFKIFGDSDEVFKIKGGNQKLIESLQNKLKEQIHTEHSITAIKTSANKISLKFSNNKEVTVDHVVLAIPYSILRNIEMSIENISSEKLTCINELGYGQNNKILFGFKNRPWREGSSKKYSGYLFNELVQNGWDNSQMQNDNKGVGGYTIFIGGKQSIGLASNAKANNDKDTIPDSELQKYLSALDKAFPSSKSNFNGNHKAVFWSNNPFIKGSYSCYKVGQWTTISGKVIEPIGNISFAGEHCSSDFQGFMNGGAETGRRAAEGIIKQLALEKIKPSEVELV